MNAALYILCGLTALSLVPVLRGPTLYDRLLGLQLTSGQLVLVMCVFAVARGRAYDLDVAVVYALLSFIEVLVFVRIRAAARAGGRSAA